MIQKEGNISKIDLTEFQKTVSFTTVTGKDYGRNFSCETGFDLGKKTLDFFGMCLNAFKSSVLKRNENEKKYKR